MSPLQAQSDAAIAGAGFVTASPCQATRRSGVSGERRILPPDSAMPALCRDAATRVGFTRLDLVAAVAGLLALDGARAHRGGGRRGAAAVAGRADAGRTGADGVLRQQAGGAGPGAAGLGGGRSGRTPTGLRHGEFAPGARKLQKTATSWLTSQGGRGAYYASVQDENSHAQFDRTPASPP